MRGGFLIQVEDMDNAHCIQPIPAKGIIDLLLPSLLFLICMRGCLALAGDFIQFTEKWKRKRLSAAELNPLSPNYVGHIEARRRGARCICRYLHVNPYCPWHGR